jgi:PadR family transcriptional regulator PadR
MAPSGPMQRLEQKTTVECLWPHILSLMTEEPVYAYEIRGLIKERFGFTVGQVTAYLVLYKLERDGYVKAQWRQVRNRQRKYYSITEKGRKALKEAAGYYGGMADSLSKER